MLEKELEILIEELEAEKYNLQFLIDTAVKEKEYLTAHFHNEALKKNAAQLSILYSLYDKSYTEKNNKIRERSHYYQLLKLEDEESVQNYIESKIKALNAALEHLEVDQVIPINDDQQNVSSHIDLLLEGKIPAFKIVLFKNKQVIIELKKVKQEIVISLSDNNQSINFFMSTQLSKLSTLGFVQVGQQATLQLTWTDKGVDIKSRIMTLLSILTLEIFQCNGSDSQAYIEPA